MLRFQPAGNQLTKKHFGCNLNKRGQSENTIPVADTHSEIANRYKNFPRKNTYETRQTRKQTHPQSEFSKRVETDKNLTVRNSILESNVPVTDTHSDVTNRNEHVSQKTFETYQTRKTILPTIRVSKANGHRQRHAYRKLYLRKYGYCCRRAF